MLALFALPAFLVFAASHANAQPAPSRQGAQRFLARYCFDCHEGAAPEAGVNLTLLASATDPQQLHDVIEVLGKREMPPVDADQPAEAERKQVIAALQAELHKILTSKPVAHPAPIRRMNRHQYNNAVKDLFQLNCVVLTLPERMMREHKNYFQPASGKMPDVVHVGSRPLGKSQMIEPRLLGVSAFPQDLRAEHGFDNQADHLSLSPLLLESFLRLSQSIVHSRDFGPKTVGIWKAFFAEPNDASDRATVLRQRIKPFLTRAFRRPPLPADLERYVEHARQRIESGDSFPIAMKSVAAAALASPRFLYLYAPTENDDYALASRLSQFLWVSIPDQTLLDLAASGELKKPEVLRAQVQRMLRDEKVKRFCDSFPTQWLQLERIIASAPNREQHPDFYFGKYRTSMHMMLEPLLVFETVLVENRPITDLIDSDFTYRSGRLDRLYYGNKNRLADKRNPVTVIPFHRVPVRDRREGGVLTTAATMTMTSGPERTKPITRGAWLATVLFNDPPKPPPADVPPLNEKPVDDEAKLTLRERLAAHRDHASCAGCHQKIDPLGFALENYGPTGKWRTEYPNGREIDATGALFREREFDSIVAFKDAILAEKSRYGRGFAKHLLAYALARHVNVYDDLAINQIMNEAEDKDWKLQSMLEAVVVSAAFRNLPSKSTSEPPDSTEPSELKP